MIHSITIPASGIWPVRLDGTYFCCVSCSADFYLRIDNEGKQPVQAGTRFQRSRPFSSLVFINAGATVNDVVFWVGTTPYESPVSSASLSATSLAALVAALTAPQALTAEIDNLSNESKVYTNFRELAVTNTGTINITVGGKTVVPGYGAAWTAAGRFDSYASLTINCTGTGGAAMVVQTTLEH